MKTDTLSLSFNSGCQDKGQNSANCGYLYESDNKSERKEDIYHFHEAPKIHLLEPVIKGGT